MCDLFAVSALQSLRRELNGGQRVLDFVSNPAGNIGPCRLPLIEKLPGNVFKRDDVPVTFATDLDRQRKQFAPAVMRYDASGQASPDHCANLRCKIIERAGQLLRGGIVFQHSLRRCVHQEHIQVGID